MGLLLWIFMEGFYALRPITSPHPPPWLTLWSISVYVLTWTLIRHFANPLEPKRQYPPILPIPTDSNLTPRLYFYETCLIYHKTLTTPVFLFQFIRHSTPYHILRFRVLSSRVLSLLSFARLPSLFLVPPTLT